MATPLKVPAASAAIQMNSPSTGEARPPALTKQPSMASAKPVRKVGKYILGKTLGQGTFGKVNLATDTETGRHVAIKMMDKAKIRASNMGEQVKKEISIMKLIKHPSVIQLIEVLASATTIYIVLELVTGGELFDRIIEQGHFTEDEARFYYKQLISGIAQCHAHGVYHRDLKPENLLLDNSNPPQLKISDFGLSALSNADGTQNPNATADLLHTTCGSPNYVAPEVLMDKGYDGKAADVWSSGVILYVLLAGFLPFDETSMVELFRKIVKADFAYPSSLSPEAVSLLGIILNPDPEKRATIDQIKAHPWYRGVTLEHAQKELEEAARARVAALTLAAEQGAMNADGSLQPPNGHKRNPSNGSSNGVVDMSQAITWVEDKLSAPVKALGGLVTKVGDAIGSSPGTTPSSTSAAPIAISGTTPTTPFSPKSLDNLDPATRARLLKMGGVSQQDLDLMNMNDPLALDYDEIETKGPIQLNAFDLINMVGGAAMGRMFERGSDKKAVRTFTQFTTNLPLADIMKRLEEIVRSMPETSYRFYEKQTLIKFSRNTARGKILGCIQIYLLTPKLFMVEFAKLKGDAFLFHDCFREFKERFFGIAGPATTPVSPHEAAYGSDDDDDDE